MRPPRHRFSDDVRSTTRSVAARMIQEGAIAQTPEELDAWITTRPDVKGFLERGGYSTDFTSHDLFPLLQAFLGQTAGPAPEAEKPHSSLKPLWLAGAALLAAILVGAVIGLLS